MRVVKLKNNKVDVVREAVKVLREGGVIVYPTDTAYALGCDAENKRACARVFKIKQRMKEKNLPLIAGSVAMVKRFCVIDPVSEKLIKKYWPGALTVVLKVKSYKVHKVIGKGGTMAVRVPESKIARAISQKLGRPIVSTSANLAGQPPCYSVPEVLRQLGRPLTLPHSTRTVWVQYGAGLSHKGRGKLEVDLILDGGVLPKRKPSTIVKVSNNKLEVLRQGGVIVKSS